MTVEMIRGEKMSKRAPQKGNNEIEVDKYRFRKNNTPQTTYSLKSYRFKDRDPNGHDLPKVRGRQHMGDAANESTDLIPLLRVLWHHSN